MTGQGDGMEHTLLRYNRVGVCYDGKEIVRDISFSLGPGEILGIAGESGSGKSTVIKAALGILGPGGTISEGDIWYKGKNLAELPESDMRQIRGNQIGMIFQNAKESFCPVRTIGSQIYDSIAAHRRITRAEADDQAEEIFTRLGFADARKILKKYPFELSGGMNQRVGIAMAMILHPAVLLADEPTSALDVMNQSQVLEELLALREIYGTAIVLVTHNINVVSAMADTVLILHKGSVEEYGEADRVLNCPQAEYTKKLLAAVPKLRRK